MSSYYGNYSQYLGAQKCCSLKTQGPQGPVGPTGPAAVGIQGPTGASAYTAYATYGADTNPLSTPFALKEDPNDNQFYSIIGAQNLLIGVPITLPVANKIWNINVSIVETGLNRLEEDSTFNIRFYTAFDPSAGFSGTQKAPYCFNGNSSYIINSSLISRERMAASNSDILDLSQSSVTNWYIQLNQFNGTSATTLTGYFKFYISMSTLS